MGVGRLLNQDLSVGFCTQVAVLRDLDPSRAPLMTAAEEVYSPITKIVFPTYDKIHTDDDTLEYLLERIVRTRPLPPPSQEEQDKENAERAREGLDPWKWFASDLGRLPLDDLWLDQPTRQRCKKLGNMVRILSKSPLVKVDVAQNLVTFDEENGFWAESDRQYDLKHRVPTPTVSERTDEPEWEQDYYFTSGDFEYPAGDDDAGTNSHEYGESFEQGGWDNTDSPWAGFSDPE